MRGIRTLWDALGRAGGFRLRLLLRAPGSSPAAGACGLSPALLPVLELPARGGRVSSGGAPPWNPPAWGASELGGKILCKGSHLPGSSACLMRTPSTPPWVTGASLTATATDLCTEVAAAWRAAGGGAAQRVGSASALHCWQTAGTGRCCPGGSALTALTRGAGGICALRLLHGPCLCQGPCGVVRVGIRGHSSLLPLGDNLTPPAPHHIPTPLRSPYQGWRCAVGTRPAPQGLSSCLGVCAGPVSRGWGRGACCGAASPAPPLQRGQREGQAEPALRIHPARRQPPSVPRLVPLGKVPRRGRSRVYLSRL